VVCSLPDLRQNFPFLWISHGCLSHPSHAAWFRHSNNIPWKIQFMKLLHTHIHIITFHPSRRHPEKIWTQHLPDTNHKRYHLNHSVKMPSRLMAELIFLHFMKKRFQIYRVTSVGTELICSRIRTSERTPHNETGKEEFVLWIWRSNQTNQLNALKTLFSLHE